MSPPVPWDLVIKIGGSLGRGTALRRVLREVSRLARRRRVLVLPGGGVFADLVRDQRRRLRLSRDVAHRMALLAMDQYGILLASLCPGGRAVVSLGAAQRVAAAGGTPIFLASSMVQRAPRLERSFRLTSDAIAAWLAGRVGAARLVLVKSVDGPPGPLAGPEDARRLARRGVVDPLFATLLPLRAEVLIVNGQEAGALSRATRNARTRAAASRPVRPPSHRAPRAPTMSGRRAAIPGS